MKKSELLKSVKVVILSLVLSVGVTYVSAATWTPPPSPAPSSNVDGPLNVGPSYQKKSGNLDIGNFSASTSGSGLLRTERGFLSGGPTLLKDVVVIGIASSDTGTQQTAFNNQKPKGLFAKLSNFFGFADDSLKTQKVFAAQGDSGTCVPSGYQCVTFGTCAPSGTVVPGTCLSNGTATGEICCDVLNPSPEENGQCGSANGGTFSSLNSSNTNLCSTGPVINFNGSGPWYWQCDGLYGGNPMSCSANVVENGTCGSANGGTFSSAPSTNLCTSSSGSSSVSGSGSSNTGYWKWDCRDSDWETNPQSTPANCTANRTPFTNGACGSKDGGTFSSLNSGSSNLCNPGTVASFAGNGPWTWGCNGSGTGTNTSATACHANKTAPSPTANILTVWGNSKLNGNLDVTDALTVTGNITSNNKLVCLQDGTNCPVQAPTTTPPPPPPPSSTPSFWQANASNANNIESVQTAGGLVKITGGILNLGTGSYTLNQNISILKSLKLDNNSGSLSSPDLFGSTRLTLGNNSTGANSVLKLDVNEITLKSNNIKITVPNLIPSSGENQLCIDSSGNIKVCASTPLFPITSVGQSFQGGTVFYLTPDGQHGLIASNQDSPQMAWGCNNLDTPGDGTAMGTGESNTSAIVGICAGSSAASWANALTQGGYSDWFLPSKDELTLLKQYVGLSTGLKYWSSSEINSTNAWAYNVSTNAMVNYGKTSSALFVVRPVRAF